MWTIKIDTLFLLTLVAIFSGHQGIAGVIIGIVAYGYIRKYYLQYQDKKSAAKLADNYIKAINNQLADNLKVDPKDGIKFKAVINNLSDIEAAQQYKAFMLYLMHEAAKQNFKFK